MKYVTKGGEMWDEISNEQLGDTKYTENLLMANFDKLLYFIFPAGVELDIPEVDQSVTKVKTLWETENAS